MATPTKRRKTNNLKSSPQTLGNLDIFCQKQKNAGSGDKTAAVIQDGEPATLTDEDLARKLQSEWNVVDRDDNCSSEKGAGVASGTGSWEGESSELSKDAILDHRPGSSRTSPDVEHDRVTVSNVRSEREDAKIDTLSLQSSASIRDTLSLTIPFDKSPLTFDHSKYLPNRKAH
ncbi:hypothetical protein MMC29_006938 [Sticta canariensis]|nr:hypothetical protein [Sticta canariensis]